ncbi:hypothetical protein F2Q68_00033892 [Brassica cretica]|uniref:Uncharacterized protein n=1 Tax=Brassica cretica TaxID=69181 RepID=A0A8S9H0A6_BRACR|nr:hypothetical protein F2Q68_00033892 [Brassica cretica]
MHGLMSYRRFGRARSLRSDQTLVRARSLRSDLAPARARSIRSDRNGRLVATSRLSLQCESEIKNSYFRAGQQITYSRFQQIQVIFTSQTYESCHPLTCKARILNFPRSIDLNKPQTWEYPLDSCLSRGNQLSSRFKHGKLTLMPTEALNFSPSGFAPTRRELLQAMSPMNKS